MRKKVLSSMQSHDSQVSEVPPKLDDSSETERLQIVAPSSWVQRIEEWRRKQPRIPNKSEAIRILIEKGLASD